MSQDQSGPPSVDFSGLFKDMLQSMRIAAAGIAQLVKHSQGGTFTAFAGGNNQQLQALVNGVVRYIHNPGANQVTLFLSDMNNTELFGSAANPVAIAAGATVPGCYIPFKAGLRATVTGGRVTIGGQIKTW